jgi:hypothetical protein
VGASRDNPAWRREAVWGRSRRRAAAPNVREALCRPGRSGERAMERDAQNPTEIGAVLGPGRSYIQCPYPGGLHGTAKGVPSRVSDGVGRKERLCMDVGRSEVGLHLGEPFDRAAEAEKAKLLLATGPGSSARRSPRPARHGSNIGSHHGLIGTIILSEPFASGIQRLVELEQSTSLSVQNSTPIRAWRLRRESGSRH